MRRIPTFPGEDIGGEGGDKEGQKEGEVGKDGEGEGVEKEGRKGYD